MSGDSPVAQVLLPMISSAGETMSSHIHDLAQVAVEVVSLERQVTDLRATIFHAHTLLINDRVEDAAMLLNKTTALERT